MLRKESTAQVVIPTIAFALVLHLVFQRVFLADLSFTWLLLVLTAQTALLAAWAFEKAAAPITITAAAAAATVIDLLAAVRGAIHLGTPASPAVLGAALSTLIIAAALLTSYRLATTPGYWFTTRPGSAPGPHPGANGRHPGAARPLPEEKKGGINVFRIHHIRTGELLLTCPSEDVGKTLNSRALRELLPDYDPDSLGIAQVTWVDDRVVDVYVEGELKGSGQDHYKLLELEE